MSPRSGERIDRRLVGVVLVLGLVALLRFALRSGEAGNQELRDSRSPLFVGLDADAVHALSIEVPGSEAVRLERRADGWWVSGADPYRAAKPLVQNCLETLVAMKRGREVPGDPAPERLGLDARRAVRVVAQREDGTELLSLAIGDADLDRSFLRIQGDTPARQVSGDVRRAFVQPDEGPGGWRDRTVFPGFRSLDVVRLEVLRPDRNFVLERGEGEPGLEPWSLLGPGGGKTQRWRCDQMAGTMSEDLEALAFLPPEDATRGFEPPAATVRARFRDGRETVLWIADRTTDSMVPVRRPDGPTVWGVSRSRVEAFLGDPAQLLD